MTANAPTHGAVLDAESVKLLQRGDLLRALNDEPYAAGGWSAGDTLTVGCVFGQYIVFQGRKGDADYEGRFEFLARPTPLVEVADEHIQLNSTMLDMLSHTPPAQPEPCAGELEVVAHMRLNANGTSTGVSDIGPGCLRSGDAPIVELVKKSEADARHTQARAKIARLEGEVAERDARIAYLRTSRDGHAATSHAEFEKRVAAEGEADKLREAGAGLVEWADEFCRTGKAPTYDAIWPMRQALAAQTERRA